MVEAGAKEVTEEQVVEALEAAHAAIKQIVAAIDDLAREAGKKKLQVAKKEIGHDFYREVEEKVLGAADRGDAHPRQARELRPRRPGARGPGRVDSRRRGRAEGRREAHLQGAEGEGPARRGARRNGVRLDGRKFDEVRPIWIETGVLPRTHGSAVFTRGETQALVTCTLGTADDAQKIESFEGETWKSFMLHYNFPPFSVGEVGRMRGPGRREIGHGALAERVADVA